MRKEFIISERDFPKEGLEVELRDGRKIRLVPPFLFSIEIIKKEEILRLIELGYIDIVEVEV